jgi:hypothetical protein
MISNPTHPRPNRNRVLRRVAAAAVVVALGIAAASMLRGHTMSGVPADLDYGTVRTTAEGVYVVAIEPSMIPVPVNRLHTWTLVITGPDGSVVTGAHVHVDGDMLQHGHGMPTTPVVTGELAPGRYLVEGMKFQMGGWWVVDVTVDGPAGVDTARFNLLLSR